MISLLLIFSLQFTIFSFATNHLRSLITGELKNCGSSSLQHQNTPYSYLNEERKAKRNEYQLVSSVSRSAILHLTCVCHKADCQINDVVTRQTEFYWKSVSIDYIRIKLTKRNFEMVDDHDFGGPKLVCVTKISVISATIAE